MVPGLGLGVMHVCMFVCSHAYMVYIHIDIDKYRYIHVCIW